MLASVSRFLLVSILEVSLHFLLPCTGIGILKEIAKRIWKYEVDGLAIWIQVHNQALFV